MPDTIDVGGLSAAFPLLQTWARRRVRTASRCELCAADLDDAHAHLVAVDDRRLLCACPPCALLFDEEGTQRYRRVPRDVLWLRGMEIAEADWQALAIPINLAFFFRNSRDGRLGAFYPSPAGVTESPLEPETFAPIAAQSERVAGLRPDIEALLANRLRTPHQYYLAPIDRCYALVGLVRTHWRGFSGGDEFWSRLDTFFSELRAESRALPGSLEATPAERSPAADFRSRPSSPAAGGALIGPASGQAHAES